MAPAASSGYLRTMAPAALHWLPLHCNGSRCKQWLLTYNGSRQCIQHLIYHVTARSTSCIFPFPLSRFPFLISYFLISCSWFYQYPAPRKSPVDFLGLEAISLHESGRLKSDWSLLNMKYVILTHHDS